ncbi:MAG: glycosyltransferase [Alphaproteobacteria bacterium]|nr:glycosyltransferase [Alphaproteobacteria bacterium]
MHEPSSILTEGVFITVCLCTRDRPDYVRACLDGLARQTAGVAVFEIVVVDSCSRPIVAEELSAIVATLPNARLIRADRPGLSVARNAGANAASGEYVAYLDDDAIPALDWIAQIRRAISQSAAKPAALGGRILPLWEAPLPAWWPSRLRGVLSIIEYEGRGEYRSGDLPPGLAPYGANMIVETAALLAAGGFNEAVGRSGGNLLSDEDVQLAWRLQNAGRSVRYDSRIMVWHQIQASRLTPEWLLSRLYWQGASAVLTRRLLGEARTTRRETLRRIGVALLLLPASLVPRGSTKLLGCRWRLAYSLGYLKASLSWSSVVG